MTRPGGIVVAGPGSAVTRAALIDRTGRAGSRTDARHDRRPAGHWLPTTLATGPKPRGSESEATEGCSYDQATEECSSEWCCYDQAHGSRHPHMHRERCGESSKREREEDGERERESEG